MEQLDAAVSRFVRRWLGKPGNRDYFSGRSTWSGCGSGGQAIRGIGAPTGVVAALRYKTRWHCKSLKRLQI
jgi:hypothetical protein